MRVLAELQRSCESGAQLPLGWCKGIHCHAMQPGTTPHRCSSAHTPNSHSSIRPASPLALSALQQQERTACNIYRCSLICTASEVTHPARTLSTRSTSSPSRTHCVGRSHHTGCTCAGDLQANTLRYQHAQLNASRCSREHLPNPLDGLATHWASPDVQELLGARLARAHVQARQHGVLLGRVEAHHAHRLLRIEVGRGCRR